jgi:hypothetical protein
MAWTGILAMSLFPLGNSTSARAAADAAPAGETTPSSPEEVLVVPSSSTGAQGHRDAPGATPELEDLLHLPSGFSGAGSRPVAGTSETEWRRRFSKSTLELEEARAALDKTKHELDSVAEGGAASQWSVAPPGSGSGDDSGQSTSPMSFKLRQQLKRDRERIEAAEKAMRELRIEADLAGVPPSWRAPKTAAKD